ncbi:MULTISPECIES: benzoyl-CoA 2,3-epoxidase subunit BoxA [Paraburkholderia]|uniref:Benzoyl-CoA oxygenase component A n=1 Tax=Paraburkholderia megapolitana TaxID=420953 RepID=A0A1I3W3S8_9BURK|nr:MULTISPECIES: benzoyl-CoA 2,3-epoxidase subunit BoxA [Paraburkholderia]MCX4165952.1 benzoyl-CoA 2,3-epoxidase subunit BoxA [Paraburkholderia megapolitana]MDN7161443.1 benzoyl-CoA 2,3-epoxidase subunit BoxA [Paraburkholderia sp. CHISQ3]MDQ6498490.1 benzoyl-CoA 2,3-epoxidase subunit BoxA [Paraburkholderia megapolitana]QDQ84615.1 benzoyl-CoA 2,3-epoxidase subunit BoxA [Paraburkholderia megapolitana]SFK02248.1 benzoyl-CoA oxygenase, component A [Paraburkholderia megapolitana]
MNAPVSIDILKQHLIDPEICIRCNTCEETCPIDAITHDENNYVVKADTCNGCMACVPPCPTGAIDNWRTLLRADAYGVDEQLTWDVLPTQGAVPVATLATENAGASDIIEPGPQTDTVRGSTVPPWSAAKPHVNLYTHKAPTTATVVGNYRLTDAATDSAIHHIVLDFGATPFPVLEGQSIGILPPGASADGRAHHARQYSIASPRDGERPGYNNVSLTVKRVVQDHDGNATAGVCSNYLCDLKKGDVVNVIGPFGGTFLMPNHPNSHLLMICTGTGSAPMRAMTEYRRRRRLKGATGKLMLFFGARTKEELPYFGPLTNLPKDFIDTNLAFSRTPKQPKRYVQDAMRERAPDVAQLLKDDNTHIYVCGLKGMEDGVLQALKEIAEGQGLDWDALWQRLRKEGRLHLETY